MGVSQRLVHGLLPVDTRTGLVQGRTSVVAQRGLLEETSRTGRVQVKGSVREFGDKKRNEG